MSELSRSVCRREAVQLKEKFPVGTKVKLIKMDDDQAPVPGTIGTVTHVDDIGQIHMKWETGSSLALIYHRDHFEVIS